MTEYKTSPKFPSYSVSREGHVFDLNKGRGVEPQTFRGKRSVFIQINGKRIGFEVARMVLHAFFPLHSPPEMDRTWRVEYLDGETWNTELTNLRWVGPKNPIPYEKDPDFFYIPEYTRYVISREGEIINTVNGKRKKIAIPKDNITYPGMSMRRDDGDDRGAMLHRLLMLTFHPIFFNGKKMTVNHIDGIKYNFALSNLEWTTYSGNISHAFQTDLRSDNRPVKLKDVLTGKVEVFYSLGECARRFGKRPETIWILVHQKSHLVCLDHYLIKWADDESPWPICTEADCFTPHKHQWKPVQLKNIETGEITVVPRVSDAEEICKIKEATIRYYLSKKIPRAKNGWLFKFVHDKTPWPSKLLEEGEMFRSNPRVTRTANYKVTNKKTGEVFEVTGSNNLGSVIGIDTRTVMWHLRKSRDGKTCKHFNIDKIKRKP